MIINCAACALNRNCCSVLIPKESFKASRKYHFQIVFGRMCFISQHLVVTYLIFSNYLLPGIIPWVIIGLFWILFTYFKFKDLQRNLKPTAWNPQFFFFPQRDLYEFLTWRRIEVFHFPLPLCKHFARTLTSQTAINWEVDVPILVTTECCSESILISFSAACPLLLEMYVKCVFTGIWLPANVWYCH